MTHPRRFTAKYLVVLAVTLGQFGLLSACAGADDPVEMVGVADAAGGATAHGTTKGASSEGASNNAVAARDGGSSAEASAALEALAGLAVKGRAPKTGYDRDLFAWREDIDHNGCDTRNDILNRDLADKTFKPGTNDCVVLTGVLTSKFSGKKVAFDRPANNIDIDHIVAMSDAWQTGAQGWDANKRRAYANDPQNLVAVEADLNREKGAGDAATWLPPYQANRCWYVAQQITVKKTYGLWVKPAERDAMERVLKGCGSDAGQDPIQAITVETVEPTSSASTDAGPLDLMPVVPDDETSAAGTPQPTRPGDNEPGATPDREPQLRPDGDATGKPRPNPASGGGQQQPGVPGATKTPRPVIGGAFKNCKEAWAAGAAPVRRGEPGYGSHLDGDDDGVGCEVRPR